MLCTWAQRLRGSYRISKRLAVLREGLPEADVDTILRRNPVVLFVRVPTGWSRDASQLLVALSLTHLITPLIGEPAAWRAGVGS